MLLFLLLFALQLTPEFSQRLRTTISELLAVMENGLRSADPRDCTAYTGWAGDDTVGRENPGHWRRQVAPRSATAAALKSGMIEWPDAKVARCVTSPPCAFGFLFA